MELKVGDVFESTRKFTLHDTILFAELTGDRGKHHMEPDEQGRLMVHGLHTASIGTKIGGDLNYIGKDMIFDYVRPVFTGDTITCKVTVTSVEQCEGYRKVALQSIYHNQHGKEVLIGSSHGIIRDQVETSSS